ncbi:MAG: GGDEF domain-containing protein [Lachnospiraceae bacterium]|nr:GGDEF domain-containing protein [Lachnospiraceae bacterium]
MKINASIHNSIRSLFQMIVLVDDTSGQYEILDHNRELENIPTGSDGDEKRGSFEVLCKSLKKNIHPKERDEFRIFTTKENYVQRLGDHVHISMECRIRHSDRKYYWSEIIMCNTTAEDSTEGNDSIFMIRDIHERKTAELAREAEDRAILKKLQDKYDKLFEENMTDQQTGCYNRKGLKYYSELVIDEAKKNGKDLFVCVADLNGLKYLNDTFGHVAGDEAIGVVSSELKNAAPEGSKAVRLGGDEFLLFAAIDTESREPDAFSAKLERAIDAYNKSHSNPYTVGCSYGWVVLPVKEGMTDLDEYIDLADQKMYEMRVIRDKHRRK